MENNLTCTLHGRPGLASGSPGLAVSGLAVSGVTVSGLTVPGLAVSGLTVSGLAGLDWQCLDWPVAGLDWPINSASLYQQVSAPYLLSKKTYPVTLIFLAQFGVFKLL